MTQENEPTRILIVDDEEAILETMTYTFQDLYTVLTTSGPHKAMEIMRDEGPVAVVITDQRMPEMTGVELLMQLRDRHPDTVRILLTGFADSEATVRAINEAQVYAYLHKPWETDELRQVVKQAVAHYGLVAENRRLLSDLRSANAIMTAVMDQLEVGAIVVDSLGIVRAVNAPAVRYLGFEKAVEGVGVGEILDRRGLQEIGEEVLNQCSSDNPGFEDRELNLGSKGHSLRISSQPFESGEDQGDCGQVIFFKEVSHEPLRRAFYGIVAKISETEGSLREALGGALQELSELAGQTGSSEILSPGMSELSERVSRCRTAIQSWLDVEDELLRDEFPDAQLLRDRMRIARGRWPATEQLPQGVQALADLVDAYYESGENPRKRLL